MNRSPFCSFIIFSWLHLPPLQSGAHAGLFQPHVRVKSPLSHSLLSHCSHPACPSSAPEAPPHPCPALQHFHCRCSPPSLLTPLPGLLFPALNRVCVPAPTSILFHSYLYFPPSIGCCLHKNKSEQTNNNNNKNSTQTLILKILFPSPVISLSYHYITSPSPAKVL